MRILVTGGAGFIGSHITDQLLAHGHEVAVLDDLSTGKRANIASDVTFFEADVCDDQAVATAFDRFRPEAVCHQAAQLSVSRSMREPVFDARVNVMGLLNVLEHAARIESKRVVFASSGGVLYGDVAQPAAEDHPSAPVSPYGISKLVGEKYLEFYARSRGLRGLALRYANVYGPRQDPHGEAGVVAIFAQRLLGGEAAVINGDGRYIRDYVFVGDVARANVLALEAECDEPFTALNIGTALGTDVNQLEEKMREICQAASDSESRIPEPLRREARPGDLRSSLVSPQRARHVLDWEPTVSLADGLRLTVNWFAETRLHSA